MFPDFRQPRTWTMVVAVWAVPALASTTRVYFGSRDERIVPTLGQVLALELPPWVLWMLLTPLVFALLQRVPFERGRWGRALVAHGTIALAFLVVSSTMVVLTVRNFAGPAGIPDLEVLAGIGRVATQRLVPIIATYAALAASAQAILLNERLHARRLQQVQLRADLRGAELRALKMQLRPHFLFNALQSVSTLVDSDPLAARQTLTQLGDLLRATLHNGAREMISLDEELVFVERYLDIERTRFSDRLAFDVYLQDGVRAAAVPGLVLQPLVENAIHHGIAAGVDPGHLRLEVFRTGEALCLCVADDGPGFSDGFREGVGLTMTRERLASLYGEAASVTVGNRDAGGACATLTIPWTLHEAPA